MTFDTCRFVLVHKVRDMLELHWEDFYIYPVKAYSIKKMILHLSSCMSLVLSLCLNDLPHCEHVAHD